MSAPLLRHETPLATAEIAREVIGPMHRHLSLIQERFRDRASPRSAPRYRVTVDERGEAIVLTAAAGAEEELAHAARVVETLVAMAGGRRSISEGDVLAAIEHAAPATLDAPTPAKGPVRLPTFAGLTLRTPRQAHYVESLRDPNVDMIFGIGPAGTGKTFLAVAAAAEALKKGLVDRIVVTRPAVEAGEKLGFLPGDKDEKVDPYLQPIWDAFRVQFSQAEFDNRRARKDIEVAQLAYMRGRTLAKAFVICDEAQNTTALQMKMVLTRLGEGARMVITGDPSQVDLPSGQPSGLMHALRIVEGIEGVEVIRFAAQDVVRHRLVARIIEAYDRHENQKGGAP